MKFQFRLSEQRDGDIIYWLNHTEDKSEAIRSAIRAAIEKEAMVSKALEDMARMNDPATAVEQAIDDIRFAMKTWNRTTLEEVKKDIGWMYPDGVLEKAWQKMPDESACFDSKEGDV